jgi:hypothetical protein
VSAFLRERWVMPLAEVCYPVSAFPRELSVRPLAEELPLVIAASPSVPAEVSPPGVAAYLSGAALGGDFPVSRSAEVFLWEAQLGSPSELPEPKSGSLRGLGSDHQGYWSGSEPVLRGSRWVLDSDCLELGSGSHSVAAAAYSLGWAGSESPLESGSAVPSR